MECLISHRVHIHIKIHWKDWGCLEVNELIHTEAKSQADIEQGGPHQVTKPMGWSRRKEQWHLCGLLSAFLPLLQTTVSASSSLTFPISHLSFTICPNPKNKASVILAYFRYFIRNRISEWSYWPHPEAELNCGSAWVSFHWSLTASEPLVSGVRIVCHGATAYRKGILYPEW